VVEDPVAIVGQSIVVMVATTAVVVEEEKMILQVLAVMVDKVLQELSGVKVDLIHQQILLMCKLNN
jgi:hypothetical protein